MGFLIIWVGLAAIVGVAAAKRDRSGGGWFFLSLLISPLIAGLLMLALGNPNSAGRYQADQEVEPRSKSFGPILSKKCPDCAEMVKADARICRFCRHEFS